jgi:hypothetical protein
MALRIPDRARDREANGGRAGQPLGPSGCDGNPARLSPWLALDRARGAALGRHRCSDWQASCAARQGRHDERAPAGGQEPKQAAFRACLPRRRRRPQIPWVSRASFRSPRACICSAELKNPSSSPGWGLLFSNPAILAAGAAPCRKKGRQRPGSCRALR